VIRTRFGLVFAGLLLAVSACGTATPPPAAPTTPPAPTAIEILHAAAAATAGQSFRYEVTYGQLLTGQGARDASGQRAERDVTVSSAGLVIKANIRRVENTVYARLDLGLLGPLIPGLADVGDGWLLVDPGRLNPDGLSASLVPGPDSSTVESYVAGVVTAEVVSATEIRGTVDITRSAPVALPARELAKLSAQDRIVPFTATLDAQGRVVKTVMQMPAIAGYPAAPLTTTYRDFGAVVTVVAPASARPAPLALYPVLP